MANFVDKVIKDIYDNLFVIDVDSVKSSITYSESGYIFPQHEWSLYYHTRPFMRSKMSLWRNGEIKLDLTRKESKDLYKAYRYAFAEEEKRLKKIKDKAKEL